ncbi:MAG TPA: hypothetical protein VJR29_13765 [bacterium]|nr:hypothetical protein [bacterium]
MQAARLSHSSSTNLDLSPAQRREYLSLQKEKDPELRDQALLALAGRLERSKRFSAAAQIYSELQQGASEVSDRARGRLQALAGSGSFGAQTELALNQLVDGIADPAALTAMGAAGAAFRIVRLAALSRLIAAPGAGLLTRGVGARGLASSLAFAAEGSVFPAVHGLAARALGAAPESTGFGEQALASYCVLGGLRAATLVGRGLSGGLTTGLGGSLLQQGTLFGGILLGSSLEKSLGLKAEAPWSSTLAQSLVTLLHFNAAGSLFRSLSGSRFQAWEKGLDLRIQNLESGLPAGSWLNLNNRQLAPAEGLVWKMADGEKSDKPALRGQVSQAPASGKAPASAPVSGPAAKVEEVLEFFGTLEVTTNLLKQHSSIITALGNGNVRLKIIQSSGGWPSGFLAHLAKYVQFHLVRRGLVESSGQTLTVELFGGGKTNQIVRLNKVAGEYVLANDSKPPPPREPGASPFVTATNILKGTPPEAKAKPEATRQAQNSPPSSEHSWQRFERELKTEVNYIRQGMGEREARLVFRENYPADFFESRKNEIAKRLQERSANMMVPLGFRVILQIGEAEGAREVVYIKQIGGYRREDSKSKR